MVGRKKSKEEEEKVWERWGKQEKEGRINNGLTSLLFAEEEEESEENSHNAGHCKAWWGTLTPHAFVLELQYFPFRDMRQVNCIVTTK